MAIICTCPLAAAIDTLPVATCPEEFGQVQKIIFQRKGSTITILTTNPNLLATWTALKAAVDGTKVQISPFVQGPEVVPGEAREYGGGNDTLDGIPIILGSDPTAVSAKIIRVKQDVIEALKKYKCEDMGVFLINAAGQIAGVTDDIGTPLTFAPFPIRGLFVGDKAMEGFGGVDSNAIKFQMPENWSDKFHVVTPVDFLANVDL